MTKDNDVLKNIGLNPSAKVFWNLPTSALYEHAIQRGESTISHSGPLVVQTGKYTGRLPQAKFIVKEPGSDKFISWGEINRPITPQNFEGLRNKLAEHLSEHDIFIQNSFVGADPNYRIPIRVISEMATHTLFARTMLIRDGAAGKSVKDRPGEFTVLHAPSFKSDPVKDGTTMDAFVIINFESRMVIIGGTAYCGEIKKAIFTLMNYLMPFQEVLPMHCSANYGKNENDAAIFFGLSGTGKTTLSAAPDRTLIGDDEHGWSPDGVFNFEGGCYAKVIGLSRESEPEIFEATKAYGSIIENVVMDPVSRMLDLDNPMITENTRAAYRIGRISNMTPYGKGGHPKNVIMLTCDAFGILPPIARLSPEQAMYHFLAGYTAKIAGTEDGIKEPTATFSPCFGAPFMPRPPSVYAALLGKRILEHEADVWLINTGWYGGPYGVGERMKLSYTREMVRGILDGKLKEVKTWTDPIFGFRVPATCLTVPTDFLNPREAWQDAKEYDSKAKELARLFEENFVHYASDADPKVHAAGPIIT